MTIDKTVGNDTFFVIAWSATKPFFFLRDPKGKEYGSSDFTLDNLNSKAARLGINGTAEVKAECFLLFSELITSYTLAYYFSLMVIFLFVVYYYFVRETMTLLEHEDFLHFLKHIFVFYLQVGDWHYYIKNEGTTAQNVSVTVTSRAASSVVPPVNVVAYIKNANIAPNPVVVYAEVSQGFLPVLGANVIATVEKDGAAPVSLELLDNGAGKVPYTQ